MNIINVNEDIRKSLIDVFGKLDSQKALKLIEYFETLKYQDNEKYLKVIQVMYPFFYLDVVSINKIVDFQEEYNSFSELINQLDDINSIYDLEQMISERPDLLLKMYNSIFNFENNNELKKCKYMSESKPYDTKIFKVNKFWLFDKIQYTKIYTKSDFLFKLEENKMEIYNTFGDTISDIEKEDLLFYQVSNYLNDLELIDKESYEILLKEILQDSYCYYNFKNNETIILKIKEFEKAIQKKLTMEENNLEVLHHILDGFYKFNICSKNDDKNCKLKILSKNTQNLK